MPWLELVHNELLGKSVLRIECLWLDNKTKKKKNANQALKANQAVFVLGPTNWTSMAPGFLRWVRAQGRSPNAPGIPKNPSGPVGIPLKRGASGARQ